MIKTALNKGDLQIELRCERSNLFDLNKKHTDIHKLFYGESINVQVILRHEGVAGLDKIKVSLEDVHVQKQVKSASYTKLGASMMKIKSVESLTDTHISPHSSLMASMDSLIAQVSKHGDQTVLYQDDSTLVLNVPMVIPDLLDDEDLDIHAPVKHIQFTVSIYESSEKATLLDSLSDKSLRQASRQLSALLVQEGSTEEPSLTLVQSLKKSLELVNPIDASLSILRSDKSTMMITELSPTEQFDADNPLIIESFELTFVSDHARKLLNQFFKIENYPGDQTEYPISLQFRETFAFCHVVKVFQSSDLSSLVQDLRVQACIIGKYMSKDIKLELELPVNIGELVEQRRAEMSITVECQSVPMHVTLGVPFTVEYVIRNNELPGNDGKDLAAIFPVNSEQGLIALESELTLGTLQPGEIRTFPVKYLPLREGRHYINDIRVIDYFNSTEYLLDVTGEIFIFCEYTENKVSR